MLKNNAYHILGLDTTASQKEILRRNKELLAHIKVGEIPSYPLDVDIIDIPRTTATAKRALQDLQSPKNGMKDFFFWFHLADEHDEKAFAAIKEKKYEEAFTIWGTAAKTNSSKSYFYRKNLALLSTLLLIKKDDLEELKRSLVLWKAIIDSEKFWKFFEKAYEAQEHNSVTHEVFATFRNQVPEHLADIYSDLYLIHKKTEYISEFRDKFNAKGEKFNKEILTPLYASINENIEKLEGMHISEDGVADTEERELVKHANSEIQSGLTVLQSLGFYEDSQTNVLRDRAATALRSIALDVNNELDEHELAEEVAGMAEALSGTECLKKQIKDDLKTIHSNVLGVKHKTVMDGVVALIKAGKYSDAVTKINYHLSSIDTDQELKDILRRYKSELEKKLEKHGEPISSAPSLGTINGVGLKIYGDTLYFVVLYIPIFPIARYSLEASYTSKSYTFYGKLRLHNWQKIWAGIAAIAALFMLGSMFSDSDTRSASSSRSSYSTPARSSSYSSNTRSLDSDTVQVGKFSCSRYHSTQLRALVPTESSETIEALQHSLNRRGDEIERLRASIDAASVSEYSSQYEIDQHSVLIDDYNSKVAAYKTDVTNAKSRIRKYNNEVDAHNKYLTDNCTPTR